MSLETPVAFLIFNRPDLTRRVFEAIREAAPRQLLVVADGPRNEAEADLCRQTRAIIEEVDWPCQVQTNFSETNLGCKQRVSSGLDWVFSQVEEAIILEDDCLPHPSFFRFCSELLARYRDDGRVMMISGDNFQPGPVSEFSYYFSRFAHIWGWASWRRAWRHYDVEMKRWPAFQQQNALPFETEGNRYWVDVFNRTWKGEVDTWDYQWQFAIWSQNGLVALPQQNLISNIGFDARATHTKQATAFANLTTKDIGPLSHPTTVAPNLEADAVTAQRMFTPPTPPSLLRRVAKRLIRSAKPEAKG